MGLEELLFGSDPLSRIFVAAFTMVGVPAVIYMLGQRRDARLVVGSTAFIASALGVVTAGDLLRLLVYWELTVLVACWLIVQDRKPSSFTVAYRYFLFQAVGGISLFFAIVIQYAASGSFDMGPLSPGSVPFFLVAFSIKAAVVPLHIWVPLTYPSVPPAVAVILSAYGTKIGVYAFARLLPGIPWVAYAGAFMALFGVAMALRQNSARRLLSYHIISQVGYMIAGIGVGTELGIGGGVLHMLNNVIFKSLLFMVAGVVLWRTGTDVLARVGEVRKSMPLAFVAALTGAAAIAGLPPWNGYASKTLLKAATEGQELLQWSLFLAGIGTAFSFAKFVWYLFLHQKLSPESCRSSSFTGENNSVPCAGGGESRRFDLLAGLAMSILALLCVGQGVFYRWFYTIGFDPPAYAVYGWGEMVAGTIPVVTGVMLFALSQVAGKGASLAFLNSKTGASPSGPWDVDAVYSWLLARVLEVSRSIALRARDETQGYILVITAVLLALAAFLNWYS